MEIKPTKAERKRQAVAALAKFAELFPVCFAADESGPHRPLEINIHHDLIERGVQLSEAQALRLYARRVATKRRSLPAVRATASTVTHTGKS